MQILLYKNELDSYKHQNDELMHEISENMLSYKKHQ